MDTQYNSPALAKYDALRTGGDDVQREISRLIDAVGDLLLEGDTWSPLVEFAFADLHIALSLPDYYEQVLRPLCSHYTQGDYEAYIGEETTEYEAYVHRTPELKKSFFIKYNGPQ
jgi:hypothetical protein